VGFSNLNGTAVFSRSIAEKKRMDNYETLRALVESLGPDFAKFYDKGNKAAGTRVRKGMQELKALAQQIRVEVQGQKNG
jgi:hypothetical protein